MLITETIGFIALIVVYSYIIMSIDSIDLDLFKYVVSNKCSTGIFQESLKEYSKHFMFDRALVCVGLALTMFSLAVLVVVVCHFYPIKKFTQKAVSYIKKQRSLMERRSTLRSQ
jgi:hypothetical protein